MSSYALQASSQSSIARDPLACGMCTHHRETHIIRREYIPSNVSGCHTWEVEGSYKGGIKGYAVALGITELLDDSMTYWISTVCVCIARPLVVCLLAGLHRKVPFGLPSSNFMDCHLK